MTSPQQRAGRAPFPRSRIVTGILVALLLVMSLPRLASRIGSDQWKQLSQSKIRSLRVGMSEEEVVQILGEPNETRVEQPSETTTSDAGSSGATVMFLYTKRVGRYVVPVLWVTMVGGRLYGVSARDWNGQIHHPDTATVYYLDPLEQRETEDFDKAFRK